MEDPGKTREHAGIPVRSLKRTLGDSLNMFVLSGVNSMLLHRLGEFNYFYQQYTPSKYI